MKFNFEVKLTNKAIATEFVQKYHYSPVMPAITKHYLGFYSESELKGVLTLGWGTKPRHTFNKMFTELGVLDKKKEGTWASKDESYWASKDESYFVGEYKDKKNDDEADIPWEGTGYDKDGNILGKYVKGKWNGTFVEDINDWYYEIGKMCLSPDLNDTRGAGSQMVSATIKWLKNNTKCQFLYTMADGIMGKCGFVYQASNFYYGEQYFTSVYMMENGEKLHPRTSKQLCIENANYIRKNVDSTYDKTQVHWLTSDFMIHKEIKRINGLMFRYLYPLNKRAKRLMKHSSMDWNKNYPKEINLEWVDVTDRKNKKTVPQPKFDLDIQNIKYNKKNVNIHQSANLDTFFKSS
jgi:hypothetical protein